MTATRPTIGARRERAGARTTALGLAAVAAVAAIGSAPGAVRGQDARQEVTLRALPSGWIGVSIEVPVRADGSLARPDGLLVTRVMEDSPAGRAGLRPGERIVRVNGRRATTELFERTARALEPGDRIALTIEGDGYEKEVRVAAAPRPQSPMHFLPREMVVRISSKVDSLRFYAVQTTAAGTTATGNVEMTIEAARVGDMARAVSSSGGDVEERVTVRAAGESHREPVRVLLGGEEITTWFESVQGADSLHERLFGVRVGEGAPSMSFVRSAAPEGPTGVVRTSGAALTAESAPSVFSVVEQRDLVAGARLAPVGPDLAAYFDVESGLLVTETIPGTPSTEAGLRPGDVLVEVDGRALDEIEAFRRAWASAGHENRTLTLTLVRHGEPMELRLPG